MGQDMLDTDDDSQRTNFHDSRPHAGVLDRANYDLWLDPGMTSVAEVSTLLKPYDAQLMRRYPVSPRINDVANDDEPCSRHDELVRSQDQLF